MYWAAKRIIEVLALAARHCFSAHGVDIHLGVSVRRIASALQNSIRQQPALELKTKSCGDGNPGLKLDRSADEDTPAKAVRQ